MRERPRFRPFNDVQTLGTCAPDSTVNVFIRKTPWPLYVRIVGITETVQPNNPAVRVVGLDGHQRGKLRIFGGGTTARMLTR